MMSINFAMYYSCLTSAVSYVVKPCFIGTAWGAVGSSIGLSQCLVPLAFIPIINSDSNLSVSYQRLNYFAIVLAAIPVLFGFWINFNSNY